MRDCKRCGRCCKYILLPFHQGAKFDHLVLFHRGIKVAKHNLIVPCKCHFLKPAADIPGRYYCEIHGTIGYPRSCAAQVPGGDECELLHEEIP